MIYNDGPPIRIPIKYGEDDLAGRWLVDYPFKGKNFIQWNSASFTREQIINKIRNMTTGHFYLGPSWIYLEDDEDWNNFRLAV